MSPRGPLDGGEARRREAAGLAIFVLALAFVAVALAADALMRVALGASWIAGGYV